MGYRLKQGVHFCVIRGRVIFLDILTDRYSGLSDACSAAFVRLTRAQPPEHGDPELITSLVRKELLVAAETQTPFHVAPPPPTEDCENCPQRSPQARECLHVLVAQIYWRRQLRQNGLATTLQKLQRRRQAVAMVPLCASSTDCSDVRAAFRRTSIVLTSVDQCLPRSIAFAAACYDRGLLPDLVFGVRAGPFAAHCWVQSKGRILNDSFDQVRLFTPIFAQ